MPDSLTETRNKPSQRERTEGPAEMNSAHLNSVIKSQIPPFNFNRINSASVFWTPSRFHGYKNKPQSLSPRKLLLKRIIGTKAAFLSFFIHLIIDTEFLHYSEHCKVLS